MRCPECGAPDHKCSRATIERLERDMASAAMVIGQRDATIDRLRAALERLFRTVFHWEPVEIGGPCEWHHQISNGPPERMNRAQQEAVKTARSALAATPAGEAQDRATLRGVFGCAACERNAPVLEAVREWYALLSGGYWGQEMLPEETALCAAALAAGLGKE